MCRPQHHNERFKACESTGSRSCPGSIKSRTALHDALNILPVVVNLGKDNLYIIMVVSAIAAVLFAFLPTYLPDIVQRRITQPPLHEGS